ncbi:MAG: LPS translocon maturation chaperone LptM [Thiobacillus sp.]
MNLRALLILSLLSSSLLLAACGSKGPLYLPSKTPDAPRITP